MGEQSPQQDKVTSTPIREWWSGLSWFEPHAAINWRDHWWIFAAACLLFLPLLGAFGLWDPWETHYGEVGRQITERQDWISLWWGSHWEGDNGRHEGSYFFSKPILLMWMIALGIEIFGVNEWAVRIGVALTAIVGVVVVFAFGCSVFRRRTGLIMAGVLATSPFWAMLGRQAQTDMPFVGTMTVGLCFFMMAVFGRDREAKAGRLSQLLCLSWISVLAVPQFSLILMGLSRWRGPDIEWMAQLSASPMAVVGVWGGLMAVSALMAAVALFWRHRLRSRLALAAIALLWLPLLVLLVVLLVTGGDLPSVLMGWFVWGPVQVSIYGSCLGIALYLIFDRPQMTRRRLYMLTFYAFIALATLAKGLLGFMLPGAVLFLYLLITREWALLKKVELLRGILIFIAIAFPWYAAMLIRHNPGFWNRFFVHDHFRRLTSGVHQLSSGSFEHFIRWLGYGLFPWAAFIPAALARVFSGPAKPFEDDQGRATLMLVLWAVVGFTLFSLSSTTFHHYILPVVPALAMLVGLALDDLLDDELRMDQPWPLYLVGAGLIAVLAWDIIADPQNLKNLFTYRYDRNWDHEAWDGGFQRLLLLILAPLVVGALVLAIGRARRVRIWALGILFAGALGMTVFCLTVYMPGISSTMSQQSIWERYEELCEEVEAPPGADERKHFCQEPAIAYKLNWRGETYYTANEVIPVRSDEDWEAFLEEVGDKTFFGIMQHNRYRGEFRRNLPERFRGKACLVHDSNLKFVLARVPCEDDYEGRVDREESEEGEDDGS